jgi:peptidoglycan/xylan/chitin deacetylase (PgdA/CDA1 family)
MTLLSAALSAAAIIGGLLAFKKLIEARSFQFFGKIVHRVDVPKKIVALTFDDGPNPPYTNRILEILRDHGAHATFFMLGCRLQQHPSLVRQAVAEGHEIGNHSFAHSYLLLRPPGAIRKEIERTDEMLEALGLQRPHLFRPPFGKKLFFLPYYLKRMGKITVMCDVDSGGAEFKSRDADLVCDRILKKIRPGSIIMLHDGGGDKEHIVEAVRLLMQGLAKAGYSAVTVSALMAEGARGTSDAL